MSEKKEIKVWELSPEEMPDSKDNKTARSTAIGYLIIGKAMAHPGRHIHVKDHDGGDDLLLFTRIKNKIMKLNLRGFCFLTSLDKKENYLSFDLNKFNRTSPRG